MKQLTALVLFILVTIAGYGQDTIFRKDHTIIPAKVLEINSLSVMYKKTANPDGPTYSDLKTDIAQIKYANGTSETFATVAEEKPAAPVKKPAENSDYYSGSSGNHSANDNKIDYFGNTFRYRNQYLTEKEIHGVLIASRDRQIIGLVENAKDAKALSYIGFGSILFGVGALTFLSRSLTYGGYQYNSSGNYQYKANSGYLALSGICVVGSIACPVISGIYKQKRKNYNRQAVRLYNERF